MMQSCRRVWMLTALRRQHKLFRTSCLRPYTTACIDGKGHRLSLAWDQSNLDPQEGPINYTGEPVPIYMYKEWSVLSRSKWAPEVGGHPAHILWNNW